MTSVGASRGRARRGEGARLREDVLQATADLLAETGEEAEVSIRAVAARVGVTPPSIYLHFPDKDALLGAVCERVFVELDDRIEAAGAQADHPFEALRLRGIAYVDFALDRPEHYRLVFMRKGSDSGQEDVLADSVFAHHVAAVAACQRAGVFAGEDPTPPALALWAAAHGIASLLISEPGLPWPPRQEIVELVIRMAGLGLAAQAPPQDGCHAGGAAG